MAMRLLYLFCLLMVCDGFEQGCHQCDCYISEGTERRAVRNIKPRCNDGSVHWRNPRGGLRVELQPAYMSDFRICFAIEAINIAVKVSRELPQTSEYFHTVAIAINRTKEICIPASSSSVLLYLETERLPNQRGIPKVTFHYVIEPKSNKLFFSPMEEECRPCDSGELVQAYCSSDFVVTGKMSSVRHSDDIDRTIVGVNITRVIRKKGELFTYHREDQSLRGSMFVPRKCGVQYGDGDFLFTGHLRLGHISISCAPYLSDWKKVLRSAMADGSMECEVD